MSSNKHPNTCVCLGWGEFYIPSQDKFVPCKGIPIAGSSQSTYKPEEIREKDKPVTETVTETETEKGN